MGTTESKASLGERVKAARYKLTEDKKMQNKRFESMKSISKNISKDIINGMRESIQNRAPFSEETMLIAWIANPKECQKMLNKCFKDVLQAPIDKSDYQWFQKYIMNSSVLMFELDKEKKIYLFHDLLKISQQQSEKIILSMNTVYELLQSHKQWKHLMNIKNQTYIERQDDKKVGLLNEETILLFKNINKNNEFKQDEKKDDKENEQQELKTFIDSKFATNLLISKAKRINTEYQNHLEIVMSKFGSFQSGPVKVLDRCQSKLENDYYNEKFPTAAKLLDLIRCSITFNTLDQLILGYKHLINHIKKNPTILEIARVKNGFLNKDFSGGYRDIKINIVYHSSINSGLSMICECQLILNQYLWEKKKIHKIYSILRQKVFFELVVGLNQNKTNDVKKQATGGLKKLPNIKFDKDVYSSRIFSESGILTALFITGTNAYNIHFYNLKGIKLTTKDAYWPWEVKTHDNKQSIAASIPAPSETCFRWVNFNGNTYFAIQCLKEAYFTANDNSWSSMVTQAAASKREVVFYKLISKTENEIIFDTNPIILKTNGPIKFLEFDLNKKRLIACTKESMKKNKLEIISMKNMSTKNVIHANRTLQLDHSLSSNVIKQIAVSNNGNYCIVAGGDYSGNFVVVNLTNYTKITFNSKGLSATYAPCFLNESDNVIAIGGSKGEIEIWDIKNKKCIKSLKSFTKSTFGLYSRNNILAAASYDKTIKVYDTNNWNVTFTKNTDINIQSLHLSNDVKYLTVTGSGGERCNVYQIK